MYQKTRKLLFILSVVLFFSLLPAILLFTFGYKIDWKSHRILKTGLIWVTSIPEGAEIYLNGKFLDEKTPATISELLPGNYSLSLLLEGYYPWQSDVSVGQGKVSSIPNVILFPRIAHLEKLNLEPTEKIFFFNQDRDSIYYLAKNSKVIHKVNSDSGKLEQIFNTGIFPSQIENMALSLDQKKLLCFDSHNIAVIYLDKKGVHKNFALTCKDRVYQAFWHSDSEHFIVVTNKDIKIYELFSEGKSNAVTITKLSGKAHPAYYDQASDTLFFLNLQEAPDGKRYENVYKIIVGPRFSFPFFRKNKPR